MEQEVIYRIALSRLKGINKALAQHIHETVESLETFFELPESQLQKITGIKGRILHEDNRQTALQEARKEMEFIRKGCIEPLYFTEPNYPQRLLDCIDAPPLLYYRGNADLNSSKIISIPDSGFIGIFSSTGYRQRIGVWNRHLRPPLCPATWLKHDRSPCTWIGSHLSGEPPFHSRRNGITRGVAHRIYRLPPYASGIFCRPQPHCRRTCRCRYHRGIEGKRRGTHHCRYSRKLPP